MIVRSNHILVAYYVSDKHIQGTRSKCNNQLTFVIILGILLSICLLVGLHVTIAI
jgi:hypothetical protein